MRKIKNLPLDFQKKVWYNIATKGKGDKKMSGFYELKCVDVFGFSVYYYFYSPRAIRNPKGALKSGYAPDKLRLLVEDREDNPCEIRFMHNPFEYIYLKYFKKAGTFKFDGYRLFQKVLDKPD